MKYNEYETEEIMTERLVLKRGSMKDFLNAYEYDFKKLKNIDGECKLVKNNNSDIKNWFKKGEKSYYDKCKKAHMFDWIIYLDNKPIGNILTQDEDIDTNTIGVAYNLHPSYWGNGYMPEALEAVLNYLFKIGYDNVICSYSDGNIKSRRVLEKLNFKPHKIIKDAWKSDLGTNIDDYELIMSKEDWLSRTQKLKKIKLVNN